MASKAKLHATIDRFERDEKDELLAVLILDNGQQLVIPAAALPGGAKAQDVLSLSFLLDSDQTGRRAAEIQRLQDELFNG